MNVLNTYLVEETRGVVEFVQLELLLLLYQIPFVLCK